MTFSVSRNGKLLYLSVPEQHVLKFSGLHSRIEGYKRYDSKTRKFSFEPTGSNLKAIMERFPEAKAVLETEMAPFDEKGEVSVHAPNDFPFRITPYDYQLAFYEKSANKPAFALFADVGAGKTKMGIDTAFMKYRAGKIDGVIVIANKGVHTQWINESLPEHAPEGEIWYGYCHTDKKRPSLTQKGLKFLAMNFDAAKTKKNIDILREFISSCKSIFLIIDESQNIKNKSSSRWDAIFNIRKKCRYVLIMSGTPIARNLCDYWAQYFMLDESIIGDRYISSFRNKYCVMGGFQSREVIGFRNEVNLFRLTEPYTFRVQNKDLPPRRYKQIVFGMEGEQFQAYHNFKDTFVKDLSDKKSAAVQNVGVGLTRLQQISCGYFPNEDGSITKYDNPRLEALKTTIEELQGKVIIWCRFHYDIEQVAEALGKEAVTYYGKTDDKTREINKQKFISDPSIRFMIASPAAAGAGIDGWQKVCNQNIYYSNSFKAIDRWQSEGRTNRKGMEADHSLYIDLICRGGIDRNILRNLRDKKDLSDLMLDDIREMLNATS